jgi:hypothetical protein
MRGNLLLIGSSILLLLFSCQRSIDLNNSDCQVELTIQQNTKPDDLKIQSPDDFGGGIIASFIFEDTLGYFLPSKPKDKVFVVDLKNGEFVKEISLDPNFITYPSGIQVISRDSIFISDFQFPVIFLINSQGEILDSHNLYRENLWEMPKEGFANFGLYFGFGSTFQFLPERNSFLIPLRQMDQWFFVEEKKNFPAIGEYSLDKKEFVNSFGKYEGIYASDKNTLLPFYLSHPIVEVVEDMVVLSYPMDPDLYIFNLDGQFFEKKCGTIQDFQIGTPLEYNMDEFDSEGIRDFNRSNSYFGNLFFVKDQQKFVRIFSKCLKNATGFCSSKKLYALIFDKKLNLVEVNELPEDFGGNAFIIQTGFKNGFISKKSNLESDDIFPLNNYYQLDN